LRAIREAGIVSCYIQADCGKETEQMAYCPFRLSDMNEPGLAFENCFMYSTSTANQRIES
jgi:hypothetical protein